MLVSAADRRQHDVLLLGCALCLLWAIYAL